MAVEDEKREAIRRLVHESASTRSVRKRAAVKRPQATGESQDINGSGNIQIAGPAGTTIIYNGPVFLNAAPPTVLQTAPELISDPQAAQLHELKNEIVCLEDEPDEATASRYVWRTLNHAMGVKKMRDLPADKFSHAMNYLRAWLKRLQTEALARANAARAEIYVEIDSRDILLKVADYIDTHWPGQTLDSLVTDESLERVRRYVAVLKRA